MKLHELKSDPGQFDAVWDGKKPFEIRRNDRNFQVGDLLWLRRTRFTGEQMKQMPDNCLLEYSGRSIVALIKYILPGGYGLRAGWCILGIAGITKEEGK